MKTPISIDISSQIPVYKQLINSIQSKIQSGEYERGTFIPSMNELSQSLEISKETVKKAYSLLREKGIIESAHGKGFYIPEHEGPEKVRVLMLFDKLSTYKFVLYRSFTEHVGNRVDITIHLHNQEVEGFRRLVEENLGHYDYYLITPHFPLDSPTQKEVLRLLKKIPNRKLILLDRNMDLLPGNYGAVYQDFRNDAYGGLAEGLDLLKKYCTVHVIASPGSLYGHSIKEGIERFCREHHLPYLFSNQILPDAIRKGSVYIVLNSQLDSELIELVGMAKAEGFAIGSDIGIISYNEAPINDIILEGLTVLSTDFTEMGRLAAQMVQSGKLLKIRNPFGMIIRKTL